jgi:uncharacterized protein YciI
MYFLSINKLKPGADREQINMAVPAHREWAKRMIGSGTLVQADKWGAGGGMVIVKAETREEADAVVNQDPLVEAGLITFETAELRPAVVFK